MPPTPVIAVFDIGKTNKKLFLFNEDYDIIFERSGQFEETVDEDGFACEDLWRLTAWFEQSMDEITAMDNIALMAVNFSTYGASFVHIDSEGKPIAPLYNYLKPFPETLKEGFYEKYGGQMSFSIFTASPALGNLNSGLQLFRLLHENPELFDKIRYSLHLPQYMSFLVTRQPHSDITSIGCHTALWNFEQNYYHEWLYREGIAEKMAPIFPSNQAMPSNWKGKALLTGVGLHDSSAALIPYLAGFTEPFVLISTGTWCISLNPFNQTRLTAEELQQDCLCYMEYHGKPVKASRLFAGYDHERQVKKMATHFNVAVDYYTSIKLDPDIISRLNHHSSYAPSFIGEALKTDLVMKRELSTYSNYSEAYHQFMIDLVEQQVISTNLILKNCPVKRIFVDGGFSRNAIYMHLLAASYPHLGVYAASVAQASAIGAALAIHQDWNKKKFPVDLIELKQYSAGHSVDV